HLIIECRMLCVALHLIEREGCGTARRLATVSQPNCLACDLRFDFPQFVNEVIEPSLICLVIPLLRPYPEESHGAGLLPRVSCVLLQSPPAQGKANCA